MKKLIKSVSGKVDLMGVVVDVALIAALIPIIVVFITDAKANLSTTEASILGLTTLFIVIGLIFAIGRQAGLIKG